MKKTKEFAQFDKAMEILLRADPKAVKEAMEAEKRANAEKRKIKKSSALGHDASEKD